MRDVRSRVGDATRVFAGALLWLAAASCVERDPVVPAETRPIEVQAWVLAGAAAFDAGTRLIAPLGAEAAELERALLQLSAALAQGEEQAVRAAHAAASEQLEVLRRLAPHAAADLDAIQLALALSAAELEN